MASPTSTVIQWVTVPSTEMKGFYHPSGFRIAGGKKVDHVPILLSENLLHLTALHDHPRVSYTFPSQIL